jgi:hypothetical protein
MTPKTVRDNKELQSINDAIEAYGNVVNESKYYTALIMRRDVLIKRLGL